MAAASGRGGRRRLCPPRVAGLPAAPTERTEPERPCPRRPPARRAERRTGTRSSGAVAASKTKGTQRLGGEKFSARPQTDPSLTSRPRRGRGGLGAGAGRASRSTAAPSPPGCEPISPPPPTTRGNYPRLLPSPLASSSRMLTTPTSPPPGPPVSALVPRPRSYTSRTGVTADKTHLRTRYSLSKALLRAERPERGNGHTHRGARLSLRGTLGLSRSPGPQVLPSSRGPPADCGRSWSRPLRSTPLGLFLI